MADFDDFYERLIQYGLEYFRQFVGVYRGTVTRNDDPEKRGRIQVKVPIVGHETAPTVWVDPVFDGAGANRGGFWPPEVGDSVRVMFDKGRSDKPVVYFGGWYGSEDLPEEFAYTEDAAVGAGSGPVPERRGMITRKGHRLIFDDSAEPYVELAWHKPVAGDAAVTADSSGDRTQTADRTQGQTAFIRLSKDGDVLIQNQDAAKVRLNALENSISIEHPGGTTIVMDSSGGVTVTATKIVLKSSDVELTDNADTPAVRGNDLVKYLLTHKHGTGMGPSSPPLDPPPKEILSQNTKLR